MLLHLFISLILPSVVLGKLGQGCPSSSRDLRTWVHEQNTGKCYGAMPGALGSFDEAEVWCRRHGGHLASPSDDAQQEAIASTALRIHGRAMSLKYIWLWIGADNFEREAEFEIADLKPVKKKGLLLRGRKSNRKRKYCIAMKPGDKKYIGLNCWKRNNFLCEVSNTDVVRDDNLEKHGKLPAEHRVYGEDTSGLVRSERDRPFHGEIVSGMVRSKRGWPLHREIMPGLVRSKRDHFSSQTTCGGSFTGSSGTISSPNWPNDYPPNAYCDYTITVADKHIVVLTVHEMDIEQNAGCEYDWLAQFAWVYGALQMINQPLCGTDVPGPISSDSKVMVVRFTSDGGNQGKGFTATWKAEKLEEVVWVAKGHYKYLHFNYEKAPSRSAAATVCLENSAILPTPKNEVENNNLASLNVGRFYLGLNDQEWDSYWVWDTDQSDVTWFNWAQWSDEAPAPNGEHSENCAMMIQGYRQDERGHQAGWWEDFACDVSADIVCQKDVVWITKGSKKYTILDMGAQSHAEAKALCEQVYGILPEPLSALETKLLISLGTRFYLGLTHVTADKTGQWGTDEPRFSWVGWAPWKGTPGEQGKECVMMILNEDDRTKPGYRADLWAVVSCDSAPQEVVCQQDPRKPYGYDCDPWTHCAIGLTCTSGKCLCMADKYFETGTGVCQPRKSYESACTTELQCIDVLECIKGKCDCPFEEAEYFDTETNECEPKSPDDAVVEAAQPLKPHGSDCTTTAECVDGLTCTNDKCACLDTHYYDTETTSCEFKHKFGHRCGSNESCLGKMECRVVGDSPSATCVCPVPSYHDGDTCLAKNDYGSACTDTKTCLSNYECLVDRSNSSIICMCPEGQHRKDDKCAEGKPYGSVCSATTKCGLGLVCTKGKCLCRASHYHDDLNTKLCKPRIEKDGDCTAALFGCVDGLACIGNTCADRIEKNGDCRDAKLACAEGLACIRHQCTERIACPTGYTQSGQLCYQFVSAPRRHGDAAQFCTTVGGMLAEPLVLETNDYIDDIMVDENVDLVWMGGVDRGDDLEFRTFGWRHNGAMMYSHWAPGQPSPWEEIQHCVAYTRGQGWDDRACYRELAFVCELVDDSEESEIRLAEGSAELPSHASLVELLIGAILTWAVGRVASGHGQ